MPISIILIFLLSLSGLICRKYSISDTPCMYNKSSCRASSACERIRIPIDRASYRKTFKCAHGVPFVGRGYLKEIEDRAKCIPINCSKKHCNPFGNRNHETIRKTIAACS